MRDEASHRAALPGRKPGRGEQLASAWLPWLLRTQLPGAVLTRAVMRRPLQRSGNHERDAHAKHALLQLEMF
jgi:hypothetical protein